MKKIKSKHLWRRGATLLLAMLMLFTCVGSALPAFAEEATGNTATVDSGDPVLADSSAGGDSTGDTDADLPDDTPQRPTLPSGEDISEETPPADESDGETVPPADSDSSEEPAAPDSGDSIPDESESEPTEQPGEGDADLPEDEQPGGEEPDPDEDEEIPEDEPEDVPFEALVILDPENGATVQAEVGEEVTFKAPVNREDVAVAYQWQRFQKPAQGSAHTEALYDYAEGETTEYWYALDDMREAEALAMNPDMLWPGIEMYYATVAALDEIGADSSDVSVAWRTPNFALEGYTISAAETEGGIEIYADKDDERHVARLNENNEWAFGAAEEKPATTGVWLNIEGANGPEYTFTVTERDYDASFRCEVTVLDEAYLEQCAAILAEQGVELTEEQRTAEQKLYSVVMSVESGEKEALPEDETMTFSAARSMLRAAASGKPHLSADAQWIEGLDGSYQYITKDTYDRVMQWYYEKEISWTEVNRYWTSIGPKGWNEYYTANILDSDGKATGATRLYQGFDLTDGALETNSEWYGKTVYFRVRGSGGTGTAIDIPAYTELATDENGDYIEAASGTRYKRAITFLNAYVPDAQSMYKSFLSYTTSDGWLLEQDDNGNPTGDTKDMHIQTYIVDCDSFNADPQRYMVDAEGNYRVDSVGWGVCCYEEPDLSGKAYWVLKDYLANGYGFLAGHDTMYAYAGAYYDAYGADLDESTIDPNDGTTWYYAINSWLPYGYTRDGRQSNTRGGHFYHNNRVYDQTSAGIINGSNIWYDTAWYVHAPARYLDLEAEYTLYPCEWCEQYHGFAMGTDHWHITGYETKVNQDAEKGDVLTVATVENLLGETVQNYKLRFVSGTLRVHPKLRFQLKATVPMYVCMYAYNGDGEVVEPTEYGITNYSNGSIRVTDINVDSTGGGFLITDKAPLDLLRGEMSMNMFGTQLVPGANTPANPERWIAAADASGGVDGVFLHLPLECYIASGNVNDETVCTPVAKVQYTIAEYGKTVPEVDDAELPEYIHGEPVTPSTTG